jgi:V8-like Glu-specific endopeptidase
MYSSYSMAAAAVATLLCTVATASPVFARDPNITVNNLLGFDPDVINLFSNDDPIPEQRHLEEHDFANFQTIESLAPFHPPSLQDDGDEDEEGEADGLSKRYINGPDDRYIYSSTAYPYSAVGKLYWSNGVSCSAALVGPRHVLTAKHCLVDGASATFAPGYDNGPRLGSAAVTLAARPNIAWGTPCGWKGDWAVLIINKRLGDERGWFGVVMPDRAKVDRPIFKHIGYPGDRSNAQRPYRTPGNRIHGNRAWDCDGTAPYYTDTDAMGGQSGGPHWETRDSGPYIWGTLSVTFGQGNVAWAGWGSGADMLNTLSSLRREYP